MASLGSRRASANTEQQSVWGELPRGLFPTRICCRFFFFIVMYVGISVFELHLPSSRSLKDKRRVVKALIERLHQRFRLSIVESDFHDLHQRAEIGLAAVAVSEGDLDRILEEVRGIVDTVPEAYLTRWEPQVLAGAD